MTAQEERKDCSSMTAAGQVVKVHKDSLKVWIMLHLHPVHACMCSAVRVQKQEYK